MTHPRDRAERLELRRRYSGDLYGERRLKAKYRFRRRFGAPWVDRVARDAIRDRAALRADLAF